MKMLFSSSDELQIGLLRSRLAVAGVPCETRLNDDADVDWILPGYPELWVQDDRDFPTALALFASWYHQRNLHKNR